MSFLNRLFGFFGFGETPAAQLAEIEHDGYRIRPTPIREGGQFRLSAIISREIDGERKEHRLVRADTFSSAQDAADAAIVKARRLIGEQGERIFG